MNRLNSNGAGYFRRGSAGSLLLLQLQRGLWFMVFGDLDYSSWGVSPFTCYLRKYLVPTSTPWGVHCLPRDNIMLVHPYLNGPRKCQFVPKSN